MTVCNMVSAGMVDVAVEELVVNGNLCLDVTGVMLPEVVCVTLTHAGSGRSKSFNYTCTLAHIMCAH